MNAKLIKSRVMSNTYTGHFPLFFVAGFFLKEIKCNMLCNQILRMIKKKQDKT